MTKAKASVSEETQNQAVVETQTVKTEKTVKKELRIYIGPTIPGVATANTVYNNGLSVELEEAIKKQPVIGSLVVYVRRLAEANKLLETKNSSLEICYRKVADSIGQKGE